MNKLVKLGVFSFFVLAALSLCFSANAAKSKIKVKTYFNPATDFSSLKTFNWYSKSKSRTGDLRVDNPELHKAVRDAVGNKLISMGFTKKEKDADFLVDYFLAVDNKVTRKVSTELVTTGAHTRYQKKMKMFTFEEGSLTLDFINSKSKQVTWRAIAKAKALKSAPMSKRVERVNNAVEKMFVNYPPKSKK